MNSIENVSYQFKEENWIDHNKKEVPVKYVPMFSKACETSVYRLMKEALRIEVIHKELLDRCAKEFKTIIKKWESDNNEKYNQKSLVIFNFDRTAKVEREFHTKADFDETLLGAAYDKFMEFVEKSNPPTFITKLIEAAFKNRKNSFDKNKINALLKHRDDEDLKKDKMFSSAIDLLAEAKKEGSERLYYRFYIKTGEDKWGLINLNFASL